MSTVKQGDKVAVHYRGTLDDGTLFDTSEGREPLEFSVGAGMMIAGFDKGVVGMSLGEKKSIHIPCDEAYGQSNPDAIISLPRADVPADMNPEVGMAMHLSDDQGQIIPVMVVGLTDDTITLDANHALAGKDLNFDIEIVSIKS
jgi:FKBP-type peptidyl-prolyl cis-trans isomerase 2